MPSERVQRRIDRLLDQADESLEEKNWQGAIEASEAALGFDPNNADAKSFFEAARRALNAASAGADGDAGDAGSGGAGTAAGSSVGAAPMASQITSDFELIFGMRNEAIDAAKASGGKPDPKDGPTEQSGKQEWRAGVGSPRINSFIHDALDNDRFQLFRQPIVSVSDFAIGQYEILIRMATADGPVLSPAEFLPEAESLNLLQQIDQWVIEHTMQKWKSHNDAGVELRLAINLSGMSVGKDIATYLRERAQMNGVPPAAITVEVTEATAMQENSLTSDMAEALHSDGFKLAIDNFKGGATTLEQLQNLRFDYLKLDGLLVRRLTENQMDREFVAGLADRAHSMGVEVIGEFVQNGATMEYLAQSKVEYGQGFYLGVPEPFPD